MKILKYTIPAPLTESGEVDVILPRRAQILSVGAQGFELKLWALVDPNEEPRQYQCKVLGTGWVADELEGFVFLGTVHMTEIGLVWHVFVKP